MLFYGNQSLAPVLSKDCLIYNLTSYKEGFKQWNILPPNEIGHLNGKDFDIAYANYIMMTDPVFMYFFEIIMHLYLGKNIFIMVSEADWSENMIESVLKLIQQRYGYDGIQINSYDDYIYAMNSCMSSFNTEYGLVNLDQDKDRFAYIIATMKMNSPNGRIGGDFDFELERD